PDLLKIKKPLKPKGLALNKVLIHVPF
ncbi:MAG: hypothetical protein QG625_631, partial [Cyanobacteriota bacterium erpe_2018_sw_39hr_WHONDRS-SW48-000098_B_bin.30]|nr:hypothetical protein [Cyanobacteriota bacterium erpe_2018_sw_39hr_WHONDRS-SW48-000098_B_bin.30]